MTFLENIIQVLILITIKDVKSDPNDYNIDEILRMVTGNITLFDQYVLPKDNNAMLNVTNSKSINFGAFHFVIVGGGAAGSVLASRLSEIKRWNILLLEAGGDENDFTNIPALNTYLFKSDFSWGYNVTPEIIPQGLMERAYPRGRVLGGSTSINGAIYSRGNSEDFDNWKLPGWSFKEVLHYFKKSENANFSGYDPEYRSEGGYWNIKHESYIPELKPMVVDAFKELGQKEILDYNGRTQLGISKMQYYHIKNTRHSLAKAFLNRSVRNRINLKITLNAYVTRILFRKDKRSIYGVEFFKNGIKYVAKSKKETILSAGSINSPQILMLSGVGPKSELNKLKIKTVRNLPVGQSAVDHIYCPVYLKTNQTFYNITYREQAELYLENKIPWTGKASFVNFLKFNKSQSQNRPDVEYLISVIPPSYEDYPEKNKLRGYSETFPNFNYITVLVGLMNPLSKGSVTLRSNNPKDFPIINPKFYGDSEQKDLETMFQSFLYLEKLNQTKAFKENGITVYYPETPPCDSLHIRYTESWYKCFILVRRYGGYHLVGTTSMGVLNNVSVVDINLKVHGIKKLRVVDAGVMPHIISGHTAAATVMIAEKAADIIKKEYT